VPKRKLAWYAPHWSFIPGLWRSARPLLHPLFILRVTLASALIFSLIVAACKAALPQLQLDFLWRAAAAVPGIYLYLLAMLTLHIIIPPRVELRPNRIVIQHGQSTHHIDAKSIVRTRLVIFAPNRIRLRITLRQGRRVRTTTLGVSPKVNLQDLYDLLPITPTIRDARARYVAPAVSTYVELSRRS
jgi:hypothetical protein